MIIAMADGHPRHPDQARRPPAQHAHALLPGQAEADPEGQGDARDLRAAGASPRHPQHQVAARGPRLRRRCTRASTQEIQQMVAQRRADREDYVDEAARLPRRRSSTKAGIARRHHRPRQALLLDLREDEPRRQGVQRDLRPHRRCACWSRPSRTATARSASSTRSGSPSPGASRTTSRCPSSTCTSRCTRR